MHSLLILKCLLLLVVANGTPILVRNLLQDRFNYPVDLGVRYLDGRPVFGPSKTYRGAVASVLATAIAASVLNLSYVTGGVIAAYAMLGDLLSSFIKRRLGLASSKTALGLDQIPESLLPLLAVRGDLNLSSVDIVLIIVGFFLIELVGLRILYTLRIRKRP